jgi:CRISPR-associated protein Cas1
MNQKQSIKKAEIQQLPRIQDRLTFIYLERCKINREDGAITATDRNGITHIPAASISIIFFGPGVDVTHRAMELIGEAGVNVLWVGENGVRFYANGRSLTNHATLLLKQAELVSNEKKHIQVARKMYQLRFCNEDVSKLTMQQLRGREGSRIRKIYREQSKKWNVKWNGRNYNVEDFGESDKVNQALSAGNICLYGLAQAVICALGCSTGLGFVHVGHELSFVYDIADLYKAEITIPLAFEIAASNEDDIPSSIRRKIRDEIKKRNLMEQMVHDIKYLLEENEWKEEDYDSNLYIWDNKEENLEHGISYKIFSENE